MEKKVCELFAGVGGFRLGLERSSPDWNTVWFSQWEPNKSKQWAHQCYVSHWGDINEYTGIDISLVPKESIPNHNLLVGGFPCQDYSVARPLPGSNGLEGKKGVLWWQIRDVLIEKKSPFVLLENVDRLLKSPASQRGRDFGVMLACLADLGYSVEWRVINAAEYGAGQRRRRIFIFAYQNNTNYAKRIMDEPINLITSSGFFATTFPVESNLDMNTVALDYGNLPELSATFSFNFDSAGYMRDGVVYTSRVTPVYEEPMPLRNLLERDVADKYYLRDRLDKWTYLKGPKKLKRTSKDGYEYVFSEGGIAFPDPIDLPARTMLTSESSVNRSTHVICDPQTKELRLITPIEAERIQGFEDNWTNTGMPEKFRYFTMGNALVVPMVTRMGRTLKQIFDNE
ncbi:cytosine-specific methyltransferase [Anaerocolumna cellulosilytica]|uniref:Cytosine-specific methyltransferase n=1 Tax=Anaerocolumna cellulosilytica TaxID=433286 RepID=A0A6S6QYS1_9FIRM|nr:DNA (cytosine-5-)-methyltransferase [Anaerocolumna cellulosilytica]MBB5196105.1 DNA (cytosine-5)-methyltransferase 1 [Anaerocolumna cellulosilytica]BCJ92575.1 cytosine-specific methyltransferase [Anaerocolumna cellulosilytica]